MAMKEAFGIVLDLARESISNSRGSVRERVAVRMVADFVRASRKFENKLNKQNHHKET